METVGELRRALLGYSVDDPLHLEDPTTGERLEINRVKNRGGNVDGKRLAQIEMNLVSELAEARAR